MVSVYGSLVYMSGAIGGWLADRLFGGQRSIFYGGILIMIGHIVLALPGGGAPAMYVALLFVILGTGLLKTNVSKVVGDLYTIGDTRRDAGFSIFYISINLGSFIAPLVVGSLNGAGGFHLGFSAAAVGMALGLATYVFARRPLGDAGRTAPDPIRPDERFKVGLRIGVGVAVVVIAAVVCGFAGLLSVNLIINVVSVLGVAVPIAYFTVMLRSPKTNATERSRLIAYIPLFVASVLFWMVEEQGATILAVFADKRTDLNLLGFQLQPEFFQSINPLWVVIQAPIFAVLWTKLGRRQPTTPRKFAFGIFFGALSFLLMTLPGLLYGPSDLVSPLWLIGSYFIVIIGEMFLSPVGLSATTKLAPAAFSSQMMCLWFLSNSAGQAINAQIAQFYTEGQETAYFAITGGIVLAVSVVIYAMGPWIHRRMQGVD